MRPLAAVLTAAAAAMLPALSLPTGASATPSRAAAPLAYRSGGAATLTTAAASQPLTIALTDVSTPVAEGNSAVILTLRVTNNGATPLPAGSVEVREDPLDITTRDAVAAWASGNGPARGQLLGSGKFAQPLAAGAATEVKVSVSRIGAGRPESFGAIPISVSAISGTLSSSQHSFLGYQQIKRYEPLQLSINLPLILGSDPALTGPDTERSAAWQALTGPSGRLSRILDGASASPVGWIVDPALTRRAQVLPGELADNPDTYAASETEAAARTQLADRIRSATADRATVVLPTGDPDVLAAGSGAVTAVVQGQVMATRRDSGLSFGSTVDALAWPAFGSWPKDAQKTLTTAYDSTVAGALVDNAFLSRKTTSGVATGRTGDGLALVVYDDALSNLFADLSSPEAGVAAAQRLVADTASVVLDRPGTVRQVAIVAPRTLDPDPAALTTVLTTAAKVPWLTPTRVDTILAASKAGAEVVTPIGTPPKSPPPPWTAATLGSVLNTVTTLGGLAQVRTDGAAFVAPANQARWQVTSTSWRTAGTGWNTLAGRLIAQAASAEKVYVSPQQITFLADSGKVRLVVVNDLDTPVANLRLRLQPESLRIRITNPEQTLSIGANSRTTATFDVTALAAGPVRIVTTIRAPDGTLLHDETPLSVRVTPTGAWLYWVIGVGAGVVLIGGIVRALRRAPKPAVPGIDIPLEEPR